MSPADSEAPAPFDLATLAFYEREAAAYARWPAGTTATSAGRLAGFLNRLPAGGRVLELGCGAGRDAETMIERGFEVTVTDGAPEMAQEAAKRLGRPVRVMRFDELEESDSYDGVWASAALLHVPMAALPGLLARVHRALKPGGSFYASYKKGGPKKGEARDGMGRLYNYPTPATLGVAYGEAGRWASVSMDEAIGMGYDGAMAVTLHCLVVKP